MLRSLVLKAEDVGIVHLVAQTQVQRIVIVEGVVLTLEGRLLVLIAEVFGVQVFHKCETALLQGTHSHERILLLNQLVLGALQVVPHNLSLFLRQVCQNEVFVDHFLTNLFILFLLSLLLDS